MSRKLRNYLLGGAGLLGVALLVQTLWQLNARAPGRLDFVRHRAQYNQIIREVRSHPGQAEGHAYFNGVAVYWTCVATNTYTVTLVTADGGHLGKAGYLYSDGPLVRKTGDSYTDVDAPGDLWMLGIEVAPHWWTVSNNLN